MNRNPKLLIVGIVGLVLAVIGWCIGRRRSPEQTDEQASPN
jgi:hypothetical protein